MPLAGIGYAGDVLAEQVKLKLPVDQWFLRAVAACPGRSAWVPRNSGRLESRIGF
jgi:hypothetical protein